MNKRDFFKKYFWSNSNGLIIDKTDGSNWVTITMTTDEEGEIVLKNKQDVESLHFLLSQLLGE